MRRRLHFIVLAALALASCSQSSGVLQMGPDTYTTSASALYGQGGITGAKSKAMTEAQSFCREQGRQILVRSIDTQVDVWSQGFADVTFACLREGDPDLKRPQYEPAPDVVIKAE